jgi:hypothetical protein
LGTDIPKSLRACGGFRARSDFFVQIAFGRVVDPLRRRVMEAIDEFFFTWARDVYSRYDFVRVNDSELVRRLGST